MKRFIAIVFTAFCSLAIVQAQDIITTRNGEDIQSKVLEVNKKDIKYKKYDNLDGPTYTMQKSEILIVRYANGADEVFDRQDNSSANTGAEVVPGMKYRKYKKLYDTKYYIPQREDTYSRGWAGVASFFIPGLGEGIDGQWGRACAIMGTNFGLLIVQLTDTYISKDYANGTTTISMGGVALGTLAARAALNIWSIFDAIHIAKVKNMYYQDLRDQRAAVDFKVEPYFACSPADISGCSRPTAGLSLKLNF